MKIKKFLFIFIVISNLLVEPVSCLTLSEDSLEKPNLEYTVFFADMENIFLYRPHLIENVFQGIIELKGDKTSSRRYINRNVLGCISGSHENQACKIDKLRLRRKKLGISNKFTIPVNFSHIETRALNKSKKIITLFWSPELFQPPSVSVEAFLKYINAASDSKYYVLEKGINQIQLNTIFDNRIVIVIENRLAKNLIDLYEPAPKDKKDSLTCVFDSVSIL
ncbi:hypothetical protein KKA14_10770, partial [bacterium]|nr:hypothetical protein [bacterium]